MKSYEVIANGKKLYVFASSAPDAIERAIKKSVEHHEKKGININCEMIDEKLDTEVKEKCSTFTEIEETYTKKYKITRISDGKSVIFEFVANQTIYR